MQSLIGRILDFRLYFGKYPKECGQLIDTVKQNLIYIRLFVGSSLEDQFGGNYLSQGRR